MPLLSIIVPIYNAQNYLEKCVNSIRDQFFSDWELILINDGSTDNSEYICKNFSDRDGRIRVFNKTNGGAASARNYGLNVARGEYVTFVDSDDYIEPDMYQNMLKIIAEYGCDIVMCDCIKEMAENASFFTHPIRKGFYDYEQLLTEYYPQLLMPDYMDYPPTISNCLLVIKKKIIMENDISFPENIRFSEDLYFGSLVMCYAKSFYYMKGKYYYHYIMNADSVTHTFCREKWEIFLKLYQKIKETFMNMQQYDFSEQIARSLLFFFYHVANETLEISNSYKQYRCEIRKILEDIKKEKIFEIIKIQSLKIPIKLKLLTFFYKWGIGFHFLYLYSHIKKRRRRQ